MAHPPRALGGGGGGPTDLGSVVFDVAHRCRRAVVGVEEEREEVRGRERALECQKRNKAQSWIARCTPPTTSRGSDGESQTRLMVSFIIPAKERLDSVPSSQSYDSSSLLGADKYAGYNRDVNLSSMFIVKRTGVARGVQPRPHDPSCRQHRRLMVPYSRCIRAKHQISCWTLRGLR